MKMTAFKFFLSKRALYFLGLVCLLGSTLAVSIHPIAPSIAVYYQDANIPNGSIDFSLANGTDWDNFQGNEIWSTVPDEVHTYTVRNSGDATLNIQSVSIRNIRGDFFSIVEGPSGNVLAAGESANFKVGFTRKSYGSTVTEITITTDDPVVPVYYVYLKANSIQCDTCDSDRHTGVKCEDCLPKFSQDSYPACDACVEPNMIEDCSACRFPAADYSTFCKTCTIAQRTPPRCIF